MAILLDRMINKKAFGDTDRMFSALGSLKTFLFVVALVVWVICPILGIIPLLLFLQIKISQNIVKLRPLKSKKGIRNILSINSFCLLIILFTLVIASSTHEIILDIKENLRIYSGLGKVPFLEYMASVNSGTEPVTFVIPSLIKQVFGNHEKVFLITQALTLNLAYMVSAIYFMPRYYPIVILFNITSQNYFLQLLLLRQYYSFVFLVPLIYISASRSENFFKKILLFFLALYTHSSSIVFSVPSLFWSSTKKLISFLFSLVIPINLLSGKSLATVAIFRKKVDNVLNSKIILFLIIYIFVLFLPIIMNLIANNQNVTSVAPVLGERVNRYIVADPNAFGMEENMWKGLYLIDAALIFSSLLIIDFTKANESCSSWSLVFIISTLCLLGFYFSLPAMGRLTLFFSSLPGFFYTISLKSNLSGVRSKIICFIIFIAVFMKTSSFCYRIIESSFNSDSILWGGNPLDASAIEYLLWPFSG